MQLSQGTPCKGSREDEGSAYGDTGQIHRREIQGELVALWKPSQARDL